MNMSDAGKFMIFCAEQYKLEKKLNGKQLDDLFSRYDVWGYLYDCYDAYRREKLYHPRHRPLPPGP